MNAAHFHLILNHFPFIGILVALLFLAHSLRTKNFVSRRFAYLVLAFAALAVIPVFLTGEPTEEIVEHLPGVSEAVIEKHEDAGKISLILTLIAGGISFLALFAGEAGRISRLALNAVFLSCILAVASLAYTANLGGKVRHPEIEGKAATQPASGMPAAAEKENDD